jgi:hypothetical protein
MRTPVGPESFELSFLVVALTTFLHSIHTIPVLLVDPAGSLAHAAASGIVRAYVAFSF